MSARRRLIAGADRYARRLTRNSACRNIMPCSRRLPNLYQACEIRETSRTAARLTGRTMRPGRSSAAAPFSARDFPRDGALQACCAPIHNKKQERSDGPDRDARRCVVAARCRQLPIWAAARVRLPTSVQAVSATTLFVARMPIVMAPSPAMPSKGRAIVRWRRQPSVSANRLVGTASVSIRAWKPSPGSTRLASAGRRAKSSGSARQWSVQRDDAQIDRPSNQRGHREKKGLRGRSLQSGTGYFHIML